MKSLSQSARNGRFSLRPRPSGCEDSIDGWMPFKAPHNITRRSEPIRICAEPSCQIENRMNPFPERPDKRILPSPGSASIGRKRRDNPVAIHFTGRAQVEPPAPFTENEGVCSRIAFRIET